MPQFTEILDMCRKSGFLMNSKINELCLGPIGALLLENLKNEWLYSNINNRDMNIFMNVNNSFRESFNFAKEICGERVPFGVAEMCTVDPEYKNKETNEATVYLSKKSQVKVQTNMFVSPSTSTQFFYNWQNQRRIWWRKISASPGRYVLTDIQTNNLSEQNVEITASYPWGVHVMESVNFNPNGHTDLTKEDLQVKDGRKKVQAHCISSTTYLFSMVLNVLCDSYDDTPFQGVQRPMLRFHRKIAPYKLSFAISNTNANSTEELSELALYLCKKLRKNRVSVLFTPNSSRTTLELQWCQYDQLGIPYNVILNDNTLKTGILQLRSRDTTLKEQVHISNLPDYVEQLLKNY